MSLIFSWTNPDVRADGTTPSDPQNAVALSIAAVPAVPAGGLPTDPSTLTFTDVATASNGASSATVQSNPPAGDYIARAIVSDTQNPPKSGLPFYSSVFTVPAIVTNPLAAPGQVSGLSVTVTP